MDKALVGRMVPVRRMLNRIYIYNKIELVCQRQQKDLFARIVPWCQEWETPEVAQRLLDINYDISLFLRIISHVNSSVIRMIPTMNDIPQLLPVRGAALILSSKPAQNSVRVLPIVISSTELCVWLTLYL